MEIGHIVNIGVREKAIKYARENENHEDLSFDQLGRLDLTSAFSWSDTKEGYVYWSVINKGGGAYTFKLPYKGIRIEDITDSSAKIKAVKNAREAISTMTVKQIMNLKMNEAFTWANTSEGHAFWSALENSERLQREYEEEKTEPEPERKNEAELEFKIGDVFAINGSSYKYRMCQTGINEVALIDIETCLCYDEGSIKVADIYKINKDEFSSLIEKGGVEPEWKVIIQEDEEL